MKSHKPCMCQYCVSFCHKKNSCREESSEFFGGNISPFHLACSLYISKMAVYSKKNRPKKWFKVKTLEDMCDSRSRLN